MQVNIAKFGIIRNMWHNFLFISFEKVSFVRYTYLKSFQPPQKTMFVVRFRDIMQTMLNSGDHCITTAIFSPRQHPFQCWSQKNILRCQVWRLMVDGKALSLFSCQKTVTALEVCAVALSWPLSPVFGRYFLNIYKTFTVFCVKCSCHWLPPRNRSLNYMPVDVEK